MGADDLVVSGGVAYMVNRELGSRSLANWIRSCRYCGERLYTQGERCDCQPDGVTI